MNDQRNIRIAYLVSRYPAISHTFILREVRGLRKCGFDIAVASINEPDRPAYQLTHEEKEEIDKTHYLVRCGIFHIIKTNIVFFMRHPASCLRGFAYALCLEKNNPYQFRIKCFVKAVMVAQWMQDQHLDHLHAHWTWHIAAIVSKISPITFSMTNHGTFDIQYASKLNLPEVVKSASFVCNVSKYARSQIMMLSDHSQWNKYELSSQGVDI